MLVNVKMENEILSKFGERASI